MTKKTYYLRPCKEAQELFTEAEALDAFTNGDPIALAVAEIDGNTITVKAGSKIVVHSAEHLRMSLCDQRETIVKTRSDRDFDYCKKLIDELLITLTDDVEFTSPSTASSVMLGRSDNGRKSWKTWSGVSLKDDLDNQVAGGAASVAAVQAGNAVSSQTAQPAAQVSGGVVGVDSDDIWELCKAIVEEVASA